MRWSEPGASAGGEGAGGERRGREGREGEWRGSTLLGKEGECDILVSRLFLFFTRQMYTRANVHARALRQANRYVYES